MTYAWLDPAERPGQLRFLHLHEEPYHSSQSPPGDDGEPVYEWSGPYSAVDEMEAEFEGTVPFDRIQEAARQVERGSIFDWAPTHFHPDYLRLERERQPEQELPEPEPEEEPTIEDYLRRLRGGEQPRYGSAREQEARQVFQESVAALLRSILDETYLIPPGVGSNSSRFPEVGSIGTPSDANTEAQSDTGSWGPELPTVQAVAVIDIIKTELGKPAPDAERVAKDISRLSRMCKWWVDRAKKATEKTVETAMIATATTIAGVVVIHYLPNTSQALHNTIDAALGWFNTHLP